VRELRNAVARRLALGDLADLDAKGGRRTPEPTVTSAPTRSLDAVDAVERVLDQPFIRARDTLMEEFEQRYVERLLAAHGGDVARAAAASGIGRRYFQKIKARSAK
jgi:DNA-binding NtrC family response regulator